MHVAAGNHLVDDGDAFRGLLEFVAALRLEGRDAAREDVHRRRFGNVLRTAPQLRKLWTRPADSLPTARFSPDGTRVVCADEQGSAQIFDGRTAAPLLPPIQTDPPVALAWFTRDGRYLATADSDGRLRHWDSRTGEPVGPLLPTCVQSIAGRTYSDCVDYSADGRWLIAVRSQGVQVFTVPAGEPVGPLLAETSQVTRVRFSPDGRTAAICGAAPPLQLVELPSGHPIWTPSELKANARFATFGPDGRWLATASGVAHQDLDGWDLARRGRIVETIRSLPNAYDLQFSPDGQRLALAHTSEATVLDARTGRMVSELMKHRSHITQFEFSPGGRQLVTASYDRRTRVWEAATGRPLIPALRHTATVFEARFSPGGPRLLTASGDGITRLWELRPNGGQRATLPLHMTGSPTIRLSPDGRHLLSFGEGRSVQIGHVRSGELSVIHQEAGTVTAACFNGDGSRFAVAAGDGSTLNGATQLWDAATRKPISPEVSLLSTGWYPAPFSPDDRRFLMLQDATTVAIGDAETGNRTAPLLEHVYTPRGFAFSPDGRYIVTCADRNALVWDAETGEPVSPPLAHEAYITWVDWTRDGREIVTPTNDGNLHVGDVSPASSTVEELARLAELLAAHRLDPRFGAVSLTPAEMRARWQETRE